MKNSKMLKKVVALATTAALVLGLAVGVSAADTAVNDTVTVKLNLQKVARVADNNDDGIYETVLSAPVVTPITTQAIEVSADTTDTLKDVIDDANITTANSWSQVDIYEEDEDGNWVDSGRDGYSLGLLAYGGKTYDDWFSYPTTTSYQGESWMYFFGAPGAMPGSSYSYPTDYLSDVTVADLANYGYQFTLSFELDAMSW